MERRRRLSTDSSSSSNSDQESESGLSSQSDSEPNNDSDNEPEQTPQRRKDLRQVFQLDHIYNLWLHAGLFKDAKGVTKDIWYAFKLNKLERYQIIYASDWEGTSFGNKNVGRLKSDLITWDKHHSDKWSQYITAEGTCEYKGATIGRAVQRKTLLKTWLNRKSPNIHAHGKDKNRTLGPPLNVVHTTDDTSIAPVASKVPRPVKNADLNPADCYPGSKIPFSTFHIVVGAYKDCNSDPYTVIANYLTSQLACGPRFKAHRTQHSDQIESAFYDCGWRINRQALERANDDMALGKIENAFQSKSWNLNPPLWVDRYRGDQLNLLLQQMRDDMGGHQNSDESLDDESPEPTTDTQTPDSYDENDDLFLRNTAGPSKSNHKTDRTNGRSQKFAKKSTTSHPRKCFEKKQQWDDVANAQDLSNDEPDYVPEDSMQKGKGPAQRKKNTSDEEEDEGEADDEKPIIAKSTSDPGPTKRIKPDPAQERIVVYLDESDSGVELIEAKSTPVAVKAENFSSHYDEADLAN
ncbi:hypothetical protein IFR05_002136 [Cadophora sp. M221]|nr:hypothetical protein IFR05_002136 [Cadophora sp. M221]